MKKLIAILLVALMALSLVACNRTPADLSTAIVGSWELDDAEGEETKQAVADSRQIFGLQRTERCRLRAGSGSLSRSRGGSAQPFHRH